MIRRPPRSTLSSSSAASDVYKRQLQGSLEGEDSREHRLARLPCGSGSVPDGVLPGEGGGGPGGRGGHRRRADRRAGEPYRHLPAFYSDLFDLGYEAVGEVDAGLETVEDWKVPNREGVVYYLKDGRVRGVLLWNVWDQVEAARTLGASPGPFLPREISWGASAGADESVETCGGRHARANRLCEGGAGSPAGALRAGRIRSGVRPGAPAPGAGEDPGVAAQRVRLLYRHAHQGRARGGRKGAAPVRSRGLAGGAVLFAPRTRGPGLDGGGDAGEPDPRPRRGVPGGQGALLREGACGPHHGRRGHQRVEPSRHQLQDRPRHLRARTAMRVGTASLPRMRVAKGWNGAVDTNAAVRQGGTKRPGRLLAAEPDRPRSRSVSRQDVRAALERAHVRSARTDDLKLPGSRSRHG